VAQLSKSSARYGRRRGVSGVTESGKVKTSILSLQRASRRGGS
jgi:hypothetical protein